MGQRFASSVVGRAVAVISCLALGTGPACRRGARQERRQEGQPGELARTVESLRGTGAEAVQIGSTIVSVWRPSSSAPAPLVVFSHGLHGASTQSSFLMRALAADGYLVIAPNHRDAVAGGLARLLEPPEAGFTRPDAWSDSTYRDRADDIRSLLDALKADERWSVAIDWSRVALVGHSLGGYTVIGLAGGWPAWKLPDVKAVVALSPYAEPFVDHRTLGGLGIPVMYQGGSRDMGISPGLRRPGGAYDATSAPACYVEFRDAGHMAWTDLIPRHQASIEYYCLAFLDTHLEREWRADPARRLSDVADLRVK
jgi:pimeloyl-ACP methyl ester carboxylesterase